MASKRLNDGLTNVVAGLGGQRDKAAATTYTDDILTPDRILTIYRASWLARRGVQALARDAVRHWRNWRATPEQITKIEAAEAALGVKQKVLEALINARLFGGAAIFINTGAADPSRPLLPAEQVRTLLVLNKSDLRPGEKVTDIDDPLFGQPGSYSLTGNGGAATTIHASRLAIIRGDHVPATGYATDSHGWGDSVLQSAITAIRDADALIANIASLVFEAKIDVLKVQGFADMMAANQDDLIMRRATLQAAMKGNNGMMMIDSLDSYDQKSYSFGGARDLMEKFQEWAAGALEVPVTRLFGRGAAGLSGSGDGDERVYYDRIAQEQQLNIGPALAALDACILTQALGSADGVWYEWAPLRQTTSAERAEIFSKTAVALRAIAGSAAGPIVPLDALSDSAVNELTELGVLPGLDKAVELYGKLSEQYLGGDE